MIVVVASSYQRFRTWANEHPESEFDPWSKEVVPVYDAIGVLRIANHTKTEADKLVILDGDVWHVPSDIRDVLLAHGWFDE